MPIVDNYTCKNCLWWLGDRNGNPNTKGDCKVYPTKIKDKDMDDQCKEWKSYLLVRGGHPIDSPEWPEF